MLDAIMQDHAPVSDAVPHSRWPLAAGRWPAASSLGALSGSETTGRCAGEAVAPVTTHGDASTPREPGAPRSVSPNVSPRDP